ncbi:MAG: diphthamide biosynthesis enzyme Dph2 [Halobacteria archaeon]|nr:diphthamide biosynthesis enzyme Dph2 [Halobacteria archaeon]
MKLKESAFDFELDRVVNEIEEEGYDRVGLQFPQGLKRRATEVVRELRKRAPGTRFLISGDPCYGACDLDEYLLKRTDVLVHFGHSPIRNTDSVIYVESRSHAEIEPIIDESLEKIDDDKPVCLVTTAQHSHVFGEAHEIIEERGYDVVTQEGDDRLENEGQVLGCNYTTVDPDAPQVLYLGGGDFHPVGLAMDHPDKLLVVADPVNKEVREVDGEKFIRQRYAAIARAEDAESWGVILSTKIGQKRERVAEEIVENHDEAFLITMNEVTPDRLLHFDADAYVNTACPRITTDDGPRYDEPVLTPIEFEIAVGERDWDDLRFDTFHGAF